MNCKNCNAELGENAKFCSNCGTPVQETEQVTMSGPEIVVEKKGNSKKIAIAVVAVVVALAIVAALIIGSLSKGVLDFTNAPADDTQMGQLNGESAENPTQAVEATVPADTGADDATCKGSYTVSDEEAIAAADTVVATMGDKTLTVSQLQVYYWSEVIYFLQDYGSYAAYFGLDYTQPLDTQICTMGETEMTWQQYFLACAIDSWLSYQSMTLEAEAAGITMPENIRAELDALPADLDEAAKGYEMADGEELLRTNFGACVSLEDYLHYWELYYTGYEFYNSQYDLLMPSAEEIEAYFAENEATYADNGVTRDSGKYVDVRHVLLMPEDENATTGEDGYPIYSEEAWEACRVKAQELYDQWMAGDMSEESFAQLAMNHTADGNGADGGLYENVYVGQMVPAFNDWCFDESRVYGDHGLVKTEYGYHIMFFNGQRDIWYYNAEVDLTNERMSALVPAAIEAHTYDVDFSAIVLANVILY